MDLKKQNGSGLKLILVSIVLIVGAIALTAFLNRNSSSTSDIRAKAGVSTSLEVLGTVNKIDSNNTMTVDDIQLADSVDKKSLGSWEVTTPEGFNPATLQSGTRVRITIIPESFDVGKHTLMASQVKTEK